VVEFGVYEVDREAMLDELVGQLPERDNMNGSTMTRGCVVAAIKFV
jgi:hypothetical protein